MADETKKKFLNALSADPDYEGWTPEEIEANVSDVLRSGDDKRKQNFYGSLGKLKEYSGWKPDEIAEDVSSFWELPTNGNGSSRPADPNSDFVGVKEPQKPTMLTREIEARDREMQEDVFKPSMQGRNPDLVDTAGYTDPRAQVRKLQQAEQDAILRKQREQESLTNLRKALQTQEELQSGFSPIFDELNTLQTSSEEVIKAARPDQMKQVQRERDISKMQTYAKKAISEIDNTGISEYDWGYRKSDDTLPTTERTKAVESRKKLIQARGHLEKIAKITGEEGFLEGIRDNWQSVIPYLKEITTLTGALNIGTIAKKENRTPQEQALLDSYMALKQFEGMIERSSGYNIGAGIAGLAGYASAFGATMPVQMAVRGAMRNAVIRWAPKAIIESSVKGNIPKQLAGKIVMRAIPSILGGTVQSFTNLPGIIGAAQERMVENYHLALSPEGKVVERKLQGDADTAIQAYLSSIGMNAAEYVTETWGVMAEKPLELIKKAVIGRWLEKHGISSVGKALDELKRKVAWNGIIPEVFEEVANAPLSAAADKRSWAPLVPFTEESGYMTPEQIMETAAVVAIPGATGVVARTAGSTVETAQKTKYLNGIKQRFPEFDTEDAKQLNVETLRTMFEAVKDKPKQEGKQDAESDTQGETVASEEAGSEEGTGTIEPTAEAVGRERGEKPATPARESVEEPTVAPVEDRATGAEGAEDTGRGEIGTGETVITPTGEEATVVGFREGVATVQYNNDPADTEQFPINDLERKEPEDAKTVRSDEAEVLERGDERQGSQEQGRSDLRGEGEEQASTEQPGDEAAEEVVKTGQVDVPKRVSIAGAKFDVVERNADGTYKVRNDMGHVFDTTPNEDVVPIDVVGREPAKEEKLPATREEYVQRELDNMRQLRESKLREAVSRIEREYQPSKPLPVGLSKVQSLLTKERKSKAEKALAAAYRVAKQDLEADTRADALHHGRVYDELKRRSQPVQEKRTEVESEQKPARGGQSSPHWLVEHGATLKDVFERGNSILRKIDSGRGSGGISTLLSTLTPEARANVVVTTRDNAPEGLRQSIGTTARGIYYNGKVYLFENADARTFFHEIRGHYNLRQMFGMRMDGFLDTIWNDRQTAIKNSAWYNRYTQKKDGKYVYPQYSPDTARGRRNLANEYIAHLSENQDRTTWEKLIAWLRSALRNIAPNIEWTDAELKKLIADGYRKMQKTPQKGTAVQQAPIFQLGRDWYFSAVEESVRGLKQEKWQGVQLLNKLQNTPGVKKEELAWTGLDEFLKGKQSVTRSEVLDYMRENEVRVEEVVKDDSENGGYDEEGYQIALHDYRLNYERLEDDLAEVDAEISKWKKELSKASDADYPETMGSLQYAEERRNQILVEIGKKPDREDFWQEDGASNTKFSDYQEPGAKEGSYRELLLTLPQSERVSETELDVVAKKLTGRRYAELNSATQETVRNAVKGPAGRLTLTFRSSHFDEPNVFAHIRFNEREVDGKKVLFIEEIQSDWHQKGRKEGYRDENVSRITELLQSAIVERRSVGGWAVSVPELAGKQYIGLGRTKAEAISDAIGAINRMQSAKNANAVPDAPFKSTWHELAFRRAVRYAAENGFDEVAWTTGEMQVSRYRESLRKAVDRIEWTKTQNGVQIVGYKDGKQVVDTTERGNAISDAIGKSMADKIKESPNQTGVFEGEDITISDTGMAGFYDKILVDYANKFGKKFGASVMGEQIDLGPNYKKFGNETDIDIATVHSLPITDSMKQTALDQGFPLFQLKDRKFVAVGIKIGDKVYRGNRGEIHADLLPRMTQDEQFKYLDNTDSHNKLDGFIDDAGQFVSRQEASREAKRELVSPDVLRQIEGDEETRDIEGMKGKRGSAKESPKKQTPQAEGRTPAELSKAEWSQLPGVGNTRYFRGKFYRIAPDAFEVDRQMKHYEKLLRHSDQTLFYRATNNINEPSIKDFRSKNHAEGYELDGMSVWYTPIYKERFEGAQFEPGKKYIGVVKGDVVGIGPDGEPLLRNVVWVQKPVEKLPPKFRREKIEKERDLLPEETPWRDKSSSPFGENVVTGTHEDLVEEALKKGESVYSGWQKDYPHLAEKYLSPESSRAPEGGAQPRKGQDDETALRQLTEESDSETLDRLKPIIEATGGYNVRVNSGMGQPVVYFEHKAVTDAEGNAVPTTFARFPKDVDTAEKINKIVEEKNREYNSPALRQLVDAHSKFYHEVENAGLFGKGSKEFLKKTGTDIARKYQDYLIDLKRLEKRVAQSAGTAELEDRVSAYKREITMYGKVEYRLQKLRRDYYEPIREALAEAKRAGISLDAARLYAYAKHAPERNQYIRDLHADRIRMLQDKLATTTNQAKRDKIQEQLDGLDAGSGMTDAQADAIIQEAEQLGWTQLLDNVADKFYRLNQFDLQNRLDAGLITQEYYDTLTQKYEFYMPLRGFDEEGNAEHERPDETIPRTGRGLTLQRSEFHSAYGRKSAAGDILSYALAQADEGIIRAEKNYVLEGLYNLVKENPDPAYEIMPVYYVPEITKDGSQAVDEATGKKVFRVAWNRQKGAKRWLDSATEVVSSFDTAALKADNVVALKVNGKPIYLRFKDANVALSLKRMNMSQIGLVTNASRHIINVLRKIRTQWSPEFIVVNLIRDMQTAIIHVAQDFGSGAGANIANPVQLMQLIADVGRVLRGDLSTPGARLADEFYRSGGATGYWELNTIEDRTKSLMKDFAAIGRKELLPKQAGKAVLKYLELANNSIENATRLAVYKYLREKQGYTPEQAAEYAKGVTVNFNKKGTSTAIMNSLFLFFNANVQGTVRMLRGFYHPNQKVRRRARMQAAMLVVGSALLSTMMRALAGKDDDDEDWYDKQNQWTRNHHIMFWNPFKSGDFIKWPLPYGLNMFWALGDFMASAAIKGFDGSQVVTLFNTAVDSFSPFGGADSKEWYNAIGKMITPTALDPVYELIANENFAGRRIYPEPSPFDRTPPPPSERYWESVNPTVKEVTDALNSWTGGDAIEPGVISVSPEVVEYLGEFVGGGLGKFVMSIGAIPGWYASGEFERMPLARRFYSRPSYSFESGRFYENIRNVETIIGRVENHLEAGNRPRAMDILRKHNLTESEILEASDLVKDALSANRAFRKARNIAQDETTKKTLADRQKAMHKKVNKKIMDMLRE